MVKEIDLKEILKKHYLVGNLHVWEGLLDYISYFYTQCSESEYIDVRDVFNSYKNDLVISLHGEMPEVFKNFSIEDCKKITAYIGYYYNKAEKIETL